MPLTTEQRERFRRNLLCEGFSEQQQLRLLDARVVVVGAGGLGSAVLGYLVAAGVGHVTIVEFDRVSPSNLQRQLLYTTTDLGGSKAEAAAMRLSRLNPGCEIRLVEQRLTEANALETLSGHDVAVDCTDNYATRYLMDSVCGELSLPMVYGTAQQWGGQVSVFHTARSGAYRSLYPEAPEALDEVGVFPPVVGIIGSLQALETLKLLAGMPSELEGQLLMVDGSSLQFSRFKI